MVEVRLDQLVRFDVSGWRLKPSDDANAAFWAPDEGPGLGIYYVAEPPPYPVVESVDELARTVVADYHSHASGVVAFSVERLTTCAVVSDIVKTATNPDISLQRSGLTYIGTITIPYQGFHFLLMTQAREVGPTSRRESAVLARELQAQRIRAIGPGQLDGWVPVAAPGRVQLDANVSEARSFDAEFPDHPLTRVRAIMDRVIGSLVVDDVLRGQPQFPLPSR